MNNFVFKCVACTTKVSKTGKTFYLVGLVLPDGTLVQLVSFDEVNVDDMVQCAIRNQAVGNVIKPVLVIA